MLSPAVAKSIIPRVDLCMCVYACACVYVCACVSMSVNVCSCACVYVCACVACISGFICNCESMHDYRVGEWWVCSAHACECVSLCLGVGTRVAV